MYEIVLKLEFSLDHSRKMKSHEHIVYGTKVIYDKKICYFL